MKFKYYVIFSIIFIAVVGIYVHSVEPLIYTYEVPFSIYEITLPISAWFAIIIGIYFVITILFFASFWVKDIMDKYNANGDYDKLLSQINEQSLNQPIKARIYKHTNYNNLSNILQRFYLKPRLDSAPSFNGKIDKLFEDYKGVMGGKVVDLRSYKLSKDNKFNIQNTKNKIYSNYKIAFNILEEGYDESTNKVALLEILHQGEQKDIQQVLSMPLTQIDKDLAKALFKVYLKYNKLDMKQIVKYITMANLSIEEYVEFAKDSKGILDPDVWIRFFESCADSSENAEIAYFYVLFELEMIDKARERHKAHIKGEYKMIDAFFDLKEANKQYPFDIFVCKS